MDPRERSPLSEPEEWSNTRLHARVKELENQVSQDRCRMNAMNRVMGNIDIRIDDLAMKLGINNDF